MHRTICPPTNCWSSAYEDWEDPSGLEAAAKRLLKAFPDDLDTLTLLAKHYFGRNEPTAALPLVQRARKLKPLDHSLRELEWTIRIGLARLHALAQHFDEGRAEFKAAEELLPECRNQYFYLARKVIFEAKAGQAEASDQYLREAQASLAEPTASVAGALDRVKPLPHDQSQSGWIQRVLGSGT